MWETLYSIEKHQSGPSRTSRLFIPTVFRSVYKNTIHRGKLFFLVRRDVPVRRACLSGIKPEKQKYAINPTLGMMGNPRQRRESAKNDTGEQYKRPSDVGTVWAQGNYSNVIIGAYEDARDLQSFAKTE